MQTNFTLAQLADPEIKGAEAILRSCVHCGFCLATCPTYTLLGDERDSPRGRIYLIKNMLEDERAPSVTEARHLDRCLSCLSCMTTCPSGVDYMHLIDFARARVETGYARPLSDRLLRLGLGWVMPRRRAFRSALLLARPFAGLAPLLPARLGAMLRLTRRPVARARQAGDALRVTPAQGARRRRVALLTGCVQPTLSPEINAATVRLLSRLGCEVVIPAGLGCCGALNHHLGQTAAAQRLARQASAAIGRLRAEGALDAVVVNASGCGTMMKDYATLFASPSLEHQNAAWLAAHVRDISELVAELGLCKTVQRPALKVVYHAACSLQHGQRVLEQPKQLLTEAGFRVSEPVDGHLCCGSAGTYNLLQPALAAELGRRKAAQLEASGAQVVAAGNLGCLVQIGQSSGLPGVHTVELLDWATGGPMPPALEAADPSSSPWLSAE